MSLLQRINSTPLFRPRGISQSLRNVCVIAFDQDLAKLEGLLQKHPWLNLRHLIVANIDLEHAERLRIRINEREIPCSPLEALGYLPELEKIFIFPDNIDAAGAALSRLAIFGANFGAENFHLYSDRPLRHSEREALPRFFQDNEERLEAAMGLFEDEGSKRVFAGRVKAIISGSAGFMPIAPFEEYFHPLVKPMEGDWMIDGGVSDMTQSQKKFLAAVGSAGRVFGFEPIPGMARAAGKALRKFPNYHLEAQGLADKPGEAFFQDLRDSSHIIEGGGGAGSVRCRLASVDAFVREKHLKRIDCVKLDVEGAELMALKGAENVIKTMRPRLIVCLYHKPRDMYEILEYIKSIVPEYRLFLAHSSAQFTDTILYGLCGGAA